MKKKGIDISSWQGSVDFASVKNGGIEFVIFREGFGNSADPRFFEYVQKAKEQSLPILAVYHFSYALSVEEAIEEARICVQNVKKAGLGSDVLIVYDFEYDTVAHAAKKGVSLKPAECNCYTIAFCEEVKKLGFTPAIYTNLDYYKNWYNQTTLGKYIIWLADWQGDADFDCLIHQYTSKGVVPGIRGNVDMDYYHGEDFGRNDKETSEPVQTPNNDKTLEELAKEVIIGKWGNGEARKKALTDAGYNYSDVQDLVNQLLNKSADVSETPIQSQNQTFSRKVVAVEKAYVFDSELAGTYETTADLYCRTGVGTNKEALCLIPKGNQVRCYGYYSCDRNNTLWLYIQFTMNGIQYTGFSSCVYLRRVAK